MRSEDSFSSLQLVAEAVQESVSTVPGCCVRTLMTIQEADRPYVLRLPVQGSLPNETPDRPLQNRLKHVMQEVAGPVLQVVAAHGTGAEIIMSAVGPRECPPGVAHSAVLDGPGGRAQTIPFTAWTWRAAALLDPSLLEGSHLPDMLHPLHAPSLPAQSWTVRVPACAGAGSRLSGFIQAFPDIRWSGRLTVRAEADSTVRKGYRLSVESTLTCTYSGASRTLLSLEEATRLCPLLEAVEIMARTAAGIMAILPRVRQRGLDHPKLQRGVELEWSPWPSLSVQISSALEGEAASGLVGHHLDYAVEGTSFMGARGSRSLLPVWLEDVAWRRRLAPVLAGLGTERVEDICQECGVWFCGEGQTGFRASLKADRPGPVIADAKSNGRVDLWLEGRSAADTESILIRSGTATDARRAGSIQAQCIAPPGSPLPDPRDHIFKARIACEGLVFHSVEKWLPGGMRLRAWRPPSESPAGPVEIMPARRWPAEGAPGAAVPIQLYPT